MSVIKVNFRYVKSQSANPLEHGKSAIWGVVHPLRRLFLRPISYYTCVKLSMENHCSWEQAAKAVVESVERHSVTLKGGGVWKVCCLKW